MEYINLPNTIFDYGLNANELMVYVAIKCYSNSLEFCIVKYDTIAKLLDVSTDTISRDVARLRDKGLISIEHTYAIAPRLMAANKYTLTPIRSSYTKIPANIFSYKLPKSVFKMYVYLLKCRDSETLVAASSINEMAANLTMCKSTVVSSIRYLEDSSIIKKIHNADSLINHYYL